MKKVILKINISGEIEVFSSLRKLYYKYPKIGKLTENIDTYLTRKKEDYVSGTYTLRRVFVNET